MPVTIKAAEVKYKNGSGQYVGINSVAERTTEQMQAAVTSTGVAKVTEVRNEGTTQIAAINTRATEVEASLPTSGEMEDMVASAFSTSKAYTAGQYVTQSVNNVVKLYKFKVNHAAGAWDASEVEEAVIGNDVTSLSQAIDDVTEDILFQNNLVSLLNWQDNSYVNFSTGTISINQPNYFCTGFIPVVAGKIYKANVGRNYAWYNNTKEYISGSIGTAIQTKITAPENASYIRFTVNKTTDGINNPALLYFTEINLYVNKKFSDVTKAIIKGKQFPQNMIVDSECVDDFYIDVSDGGLVYNQRYFCTGFIPVVAGKIYKANVGRNYAWYNNTKEYISGSIGTAIQTQITAPENASYIRFTVDKTTDGINNPALLYFTSLEDYSNETLIPGLDVNTKPWCYGKKINWIGDSIVDGEDFDEKVCSALGLVKEAEYGINGSTIALNGDGTDTRHALCERYDDMSDDADIIAVSCGTNDFEYAWSPIGTLDSTDKKTFYGALNVLCKGLIDKYPDKLIFFTTPIKRGQAFESGAGGEYTPDGEPTTPFSKNKYGKTLGDYADIVKEVCGYYSIPVLDMYRESMLNPHIESQQDMFDNVLTHPNAKAQKIMARRVCGWLIQLGYTIEGL